MHGNVVEWISGYYDIYGSDSQVDPSDPASGGFLLLRGGAYYLGNETLRQLPVIIIILIIGIAV